MGKQFYQAFNFRSDTLNMIDIINGVVDEYIAQGYRLTVRQLYYQLVARAIIENSERSYKRTTGIVNDGKIAGLIDWEAIEDRTRDFIRRTRWTSGVEILQASAESFHMDMWANQDARVFVIVEKEALAGVLERACRAFDVPLLAARGYPSGTVLREFCVEDVIEACKDGKAIKILHLGDHDPSGIDMTRDLTDRIKLFAERSGDIELTRIALTMEQIQEQKPPPNPAKTTDSRFEGYRQAYGDESWELDALKPDYLDQLVRRYIQQHVDAAEWKTRMLQIKQIKARILKAAETFR